MIKEVQQNELCECVKVIRESFKTVADELGFTAENAPRFTAFATTEERLNWHLNGEHRPMYAFCDDNIIVGYYSLLLQDNNECELNNVCVLPAYRHKGIGKVLLNHAFQIAEETGCKKMNIGIVEENVVFIPARRSLISFHLHADIWRKNCKGVCNGLHIYNWSKCSW